MTVRSSTAVVVSPRLIPTIQLQEAKKIFDEKRAYFVDARSEAAFRIRHIKGALICSLGDFDRDIVPFKKKVALDALVVVYCSSETCGIARRVATKLVDSGYTNIRIYAGGWAEWAKAGYPAEP